METRLRTIISDGDGGIRTLVPRRANAFRVRPVMTTSIRLLICCRSHSLHKHSFYIIAELCIKRKTQI